LLFVILSACVLPEIAQYLIPLRSGSFSGTTETCSPSALPATATSRPPNPTFTLSESRLPLQTLPSATNTNSCTAMSTRVPTQGLVIPNIPIRLPNGTHSSKNESWRIIVEHWQYGDAARGLHTALKDWPREWLQGPNKIFAQKHFDRRVIALEFIET
jgi:hypothetical protein